MTDPNQYGDGETEGGPPTDPGLANAPSTDAGREKLSLADRFPALRRIGEVFAKRVPVIQQNHATECGAACLAMVLAYFGKEVRLDEVRETMGVGRDGVSALNILKAGRFYGLRSRGIKIEDVDEEVPYLEGTPAILHWEFSHFVVLDKLHAKGVWIVDPAVGRRFLTDDEFKKAFTGVAMIFEPLQTFTTSKLDKSDFWRFLQKSIFGTGLLSRIVVVSLVLQLLGLGLPVLTGLVVDQVVPKGDHHLLTVVAAGLALVVTFNFVTSLIRSYLNLHLRTLLDSQMTFGFLDHLVDLPYSFFQSRPYGDLLNRVNSNANIREILTSSTLSTVIDGGMVVLYLVVLLVASPALAGVTVVLAMLQLAVFLRVRKIQRDLATRSLAAQVKSQSYLVQVLAGIETLKTSGTEHRAIDQWADLYVSELNVSLERGRQQAWMDAALGALRMASPLVILVCGAAWVMKGSLQLGEMLSLSALASGFLTPIGNLVGTLTQLQTVGSYLDRISDVLETPREQGDQKVAQPGKVRGNITIDQVSFRHGPLSPMVVREVSLQIRAGRSVALVGPSGSGKTTLARLLVGLYQPTSGRILYDNVDLAQQDARAVRAQLGIVTQSPYLFSSSIRGNIALSVPNLPLERIVEAAKVACIHDDIAAMPMGYETLLADGGSSLSGGQRQRIALARALANKPSVLLLDEATSALDSIVESRVHSNLEALHCTRIIIAHRLSTIINADLILVMDDGRIVEQGTHEQLLELNGYYAKLVDAQTRKRSNRGDLVDSGVFDLELP